MNPEGERRKMPAMFDKDFYDKMMEMHNNTCHMLEWTKAHQVQDDERHKENVARIRALENSYWKFVGAMGAIAVVANLAFKVLWK